MENQPMKPDNNLVLAILCTICCCLPLGIVSIVYAAKVDGLYAFGQYEAAQQAAKNSKKWALWGAIIGIVVGVIYMLVYGAAIFATMNGNL